MTSKTILAVLCAVAVFAAVAVFEAEADVHVGSCVWGAVDYKSNCEAYCKKRGYKGGHCGSAFNVNCWCET